MIRTPFRHAVIQARQVDDPLPHPVPFDFGVSDECHILQDLL